MASRIVLPTTFSSCIENAAACEIASCIPATPKKKTECTSAMMARLRLVMMAKLSMLSRLAGVSVSGSPLARSRAQRGNPAIMPIHRTTVRDRDHRRGRFLWFALTGGAGRNRTADRGFADLCLTTWLPRRCSVRKTLAQREGRQILERETGFEPATSTLARSHSTTELLPLVLSFYSTCRLPANSLHPHSHPLRGTPLFPAAYRAPVRQETLDELTLSVPRLAAVVYVVHRHVHMRLTKHALHNHRIVPVLDQEGRKTVPQIVESEPGAVLRDHSGSYRRRSDVVLHDHAAEPGLLTMQLEGREQEIRILAVGCFLLPTPQ